MLGDARQQLRLASCGALVAWLLLLLSGSKNTHQAIALSVSPTVVAPSEFIMVSASVNEGPATLLGISPTSQTTTVFILDCAPWSGNPVPIDVSPSEMVPPWLHSTLNSQGLDFNNRSVECVVPASLGYLEGPFYLRYFNSSHWNPPLNSAPQLSLVPKTHPFHFQTISEGLHISPAASGAAGGYSDFAFEAFYGNVTLRWPMCPSCTASVFHSFTSPTLARVAFNKTLREVCCSRCVKVRICQQPIA